MTFSVLGGPVMLTVTCCIWFGMWVCIIIYVPRKISRKILVHKLRTKLWIKIHICQKMGPKWPEIKVFREFWKSLSLTFAEFSLEWKFIWFKFQFSSYKPYWAQMAQKWSNLSFVVCSGFNLKWKLIVIIWIIRQISLWSGVLLANQRF